MSVQNLAELAFDQLIELTLNWSFLAQNLVELALNWSFPAQNLVKLAFDWYHTQYKI